MVPTGRLDRDERCGRVALGEVGDERGARRRENERELGRERGEGGLLGRERDNDVYLLREQGDERLRGNVRREGYWCI